MSDTYKDIGFDSNRIGFGRRAGIVVNLDRRVRVSKSGAAMSAIRPDSKRLRRRSSSPGISRGTLSDVRMI